MKLLGKILISFSVIIVLFIGLSVYSITQTTKLKINGDELNQHGVQPSLVLIQIGQLTESTRVQMVTALAFKNDDATKTALSNLEQIKELERQYEKSLYSKNNVAAFNEFVTNWEAFDKRVRLNKELMSASKWDEATKGIQAGKPLFEAAQASFIKLYEQQTASVNEIVNNNNDVHQNVITITIILMVLTSSVAVLIAYSFSRKIVHRIKAVQVQAEEIANGNLRNDPLVNKGEDEIACLSDSINIMQGALVKIVGEAADVSQQVSASAEQLSATTQESMSATELITQQTQVTVEGATTQLSSLAVINDSLTNLNDNVQAIAERSNGMDSLSKMTYEKTQLGTSAVESVNLQIQSIATSSKYTEQAIKNLNEKSQKISDIVQMITQISDQTNLLSLNAAIEAARAGESGKGFAVVADEVRKLAEQSRVSAEQIFNMVSDIQADIQKVITSIQVEAENVNTGLLKSQEVNAIFNDIEQMVGDVKQNAFEINGAINSIQTMNQSILSNTAEVQNLASETFNIARDSSESTEIQLGSIEEIASSSQALADLSEHLQTVIGHFKVK